MNRLKRLLVEAHQRSLWQALAVYAGASLGALGTVDLFIEYLGLPTWLIWLAFSLLVMGLPVVMAISLAKEEAYGDEVLAEHAEEAAAEDRRLRFLAWRTAGFAFVGVLAFWGLVAAGWVVLSGTGNLLFWGKAAGFVEPQDCIVVADFENATERPHFGLSMRRAVVTDVGQTNYVTVLWDERVRETLVLMRLPDSTRVDQHLALEIARRENCPAVVSGAVAPLGTGYSLTAAILETETGAEVVPLRETAADETEVMDAVERLVRLVRRHLGESLASIQRSEPLEKVTTSSLEALEFYSLAAGPVWQRADHAEAIRLLERAVELDTAFAEAYRKLGSAYGNAGRGDEQYRNKTLAYQYRERATERERLRIVADHFTGRFWYDSAAHYYETGLELYPKPDGWSNNLALLYFYMYRFEDAVALWLKLLATPYPGAEWQYALEMVKPALSLGRHGLADSALAIMRETIPPEQQHELIRTAAWNAFYAGDLLLVDSLASEMVKDPRLAREGLRLRAGLAVMHGRMGEALAALAGDLPEFIALASFVADTPERALPYLDEARSRLTLETGSSSEAWGVWGVAWGYALAGDVQSARELLAVQDSLVENNDLNAQGGGETIRAIIALQEGRAEDAVEYYRRAKAACYGHYLWLDNRPLLADAHAALGNFNEAIAQYETLTGTYGLHPWDRLTYLQLLPLAHERLGSLYLQVGDTVAAARHLAEFIELWQDADPELQPRVEAARRLLAQLAAEDTG